MQRSTLVALILLLVLGGLYWYTQQDNQPIPVALGGTATPTQEAPGYLVEPYSKTVSSLSVSLAEGQELTLESINQAWAARDASVELAPVDQAAAESAVMSIQDLRILSKIETFSALADFGLAENNPTTRIEVDFSDGSSLLILVGKLTPTGSGYYAIDSNRPETVMVLSKLSMDSLLELPLSPPIIESVDNLESSPTP